jgi:hypothetical protein
MTAIDGMSTEDRAEEFTRQYAVMERLGFIVRFSDDPPAIVFLPIAAAAGPVEVAVTRGLGRALLGFADSREKALPPSQVQATTRTEVPPGAVDNGRLDRLEAGLNLVLKAMQSQGKPAAADAGVEPYRYTEPLPSEHKPEPVRGR